MGNIPCYICGKVRDGNETWTECRSCGHMVCEMCIVDDDLCEECFDEENDDFLEEDDE